MNTASRITSILKTSNLDYSITGVQPFNLSNLKLKADIEFELPTNLRLGHLAEKLVSELIKASSNYQVLYENIQLIENKITIGELDFVIEEVTTSQVTHVELAYKFYLYDPSLSATQLNNWIGPNRNDALHLKLEKLKQKQFPLLQHIAAKAALPAIDIANVNQALCLLVSLYLPYEFKGSIGAEYQKAVKGYYLNFETFKQLRSAANYYPSYHLPTKTAWGIDPAENETWNDFDSIEKQVKSSLDQKQAVLCWQKLSDTYEQFFIVWW